MSYYNPYSIMNQQMPMQNGYQNPMQNYGNIPPINQLIKVSGIEGAKAYSMPANSSVALFHESENIMYVKTTDGAGFPTISAFKFEEINQDTTASVDTSSFITRDEFYKVIGELKNGKQSISNNTATTEG